MNKSLVGLITARNEIENSLSNSEFAGVVDTCFSDFANKDLELIPRIWKIDFSSNGIDSGVMLQVYAMGNEEEYFIFYPMEYLDNLTKVRDLTIDFLKANNFTQ